MRPLFIVLGIIAASLALVLAVTPLSLMAFIPAGAALILGGITFYMSKGKAVSAKSVQLIFLLTGIAVILTTYKAIFHISEVGNVDELELMEEASMKDSKEILEDLDLEDLDGDADTTELYLEEENLGELESLEDQ